jgi:phosphopantothenoylcysteine decarboxylase/phosphopantothenate--cysteine ligase
MKVLLGVCGSIAAYKSLDLCRSLVKEGHEVKVVLTSGAKHFVVPRVYQDLGAKAVFLASDDFNHHEDGILHIELRKWADKLLIAPLSANTLSDLAYGKASDLLQSVFLAWDQSKPVVMFPAMNTMMYQSPLLQKNIETLQSLPYCFIHPTESGLLACGDVGEGKLPAIELIADFIQSYDLHKTKKTILISTGATISPLDSVRYLTNPSSGLTGFYLASLALSQGHNVILVAGKTTTKRVQHLMAHPNFSLESVITPKDMEEAIAKWFKSSDIYISSAAIGDFIFDAANTKLKKDQLNSHLEIIPTTDILKKMIEQKESHQKIVGFAAESELGQDVIEKKWKQKPVDLLVATKVDNGLAGGTRKGFANDYADYLLKTSQYEQSYTLSKKELALKILTSL